MRKDVNDMFEIKGKVTTAICYAKVIEDEAIEQIRRMCDYDLTRGSKVRIMPDVHAGKGCTIGTTMTITDKICPNIVTFYTETHFLEMMRNVDENFYQNFQVEKKRLTLVHCFQVTLYINIMGLQRDIVGVLN